MGQTDPDSYYHQVKHKDQQYKYSICEVKFRVAAGLHSQALNLSLMWISM